MLFVPCVALYWFLLWLAPRCWQPSVDALTELFAQVAGSLGEAAGSSHRRTIGTD